MARLDTFLRHLGSRNGSDLHLAAGLVPRVRVRGQLEEIPDTPPSTTDDLHAWLGEVADPHHWMVFRSEKDVDFACSLDGVGRFRVHCFEQENGPSAVFRLIPESVPALHALGAPAAVEQLAHLRSGLVLIAGPKAAGKSTTLAAIVDRIAETSARHIVTIEDPIEFVHAPRQSVFSQREVGRDAPSFAAALRAAIRQDPDVVVVGELRDAETIALSLHAAETGRLVFATVRATSASRAIARLVDAFPGDEQGSARTMLSEVLAAVVVQQLAPAADGTRRVPVHELLLKTASLPPIVRENDAPGLTTLMQSSRALGMQTMDDQLEQLVTDGVLALDDALRCAADRARFERRRRAVAVDVG